MVNYFLASSNKNKHKEYQDFGFPYPSKDTPDLDEPLADIITIAAYKAQQSGIGAISEDTALEVNDADIGVRVRFLEHTLDNFVGKRAIFQVALGKRNQDDTEVFYAETTGTIVKNNFPEAYGFDGSFIPDGSSKTLYELEKEGNKELFSPRKKAVERLIRGQKIFSTSEIIEWKGKWQK